MATEYLILKNFGGDGDTANDEWHTVGRESASSQSAALRAHFDGGGEGGEFVAVPARSWRPVTVKIETAVRLS